MERRIERIAVGFGLLLLLPILLYYRIRSQGTGETLDRRQEGPLIFYTLRPLGAVFFVSLILWLANPRALAWADLPLPANARALGILAGLGGGALAVWTFHTLGRNLTDTVVTRKDHTLVEHGPYRWVRHPFYDAVALLFFSVSLLTANAFLSLVAAVALALIWIRTRREEELLLARFGDRYRAYMARTGRFVPTPPRRTIPGRTR